MLAAPDHRVINHAHLFSDLERRGLMLSSVPIWVRPVAIALSLRAPEDAVP